MNRVIKNRSEYEESLLRLEGLLDSNPVPGTPESDEAELLALLIQNYESREFPLGLPDPIEAIKFRMEQQGLTPRDLIPYMGGRSKVSEVLGKKRPLTLAMIRALSSGLGIPADVLIQERGQKEIEWDRFPIKQMIEWGWMTVPERANSMSAEEILRPLFDTAGSLRLQDVLCRSSSHIRSGRAMDDYALIAWSARVLVLAATDQVEVQYEPGVLTAEFLRRVAQFSTSDTGPIQVMEFLRQHGVAIVVERHLPHTYLDGAIIMTNKLYPVIGLTLRYDRIDNFWFTLMHELAHLALHFDNESEVFYDDLDVEGEDDPREREANEFAGEALIPSEAWRKSPASRLRSSVAAEHLAKQLQIHPAIVAGRMQREFKAYQLLGNLVGHRKVRMLFPEKKWG